MSIRSQDGFKYLLILLLIFNIIWTISLFRKSINKQYVFEDSSTRVTKVDKADVDRITVRDSVDISNLPKTINSWNLSEEDGKWYFIDNKGVYKPLLYNSHNVSFAAISPSHEKLGFFFRPEEHSLGDIVLAVFHIDQKVIKEVYRGDIRTSNWEWKGDGAVIVKHSCGTGCMNAYVIDILSGEKIDFYRVY